MGVEARSVLVGDDAATAVCHAARPAQGRCGDLARGGVARPGFEAARILVLRRIWSDVATLEGEDQRMDHQYTLAEVEVAQLRFDPQNPRLVHRVDGTDIGQILQFMLEDAALIDLASSIATQGFFPGEPLLCCPEPELEPDTKPPKPDTDDVFVVIEGNRRLAGVLLLADPELAPARKKAVGDLARLGDAPTNLPVIIFPTRDDILDYLGYRHITGIKEWDPFAKATYLHQVRARKQESSEPHEPRDLARLIGSNGPYVGRLLVALAAWERLAELGFFQDHNLEPDQLPFAVFSTALNYESIVSWLEIDPLDDNSVAAVDEEKLTTLARWFFVPSDKVDGPRARPLLRESRNIRYIGEILGNEDATEALEEGVTPLRAAALTRAADQVFLAALKESGRSLKVARRRFPDVDDVADEAEQTLADLRSDADALSTELSAR